MATRVHWWSARRAPASISGAIIGASVLASGEEDAPVGEVALAVLVTLLIFWAAEGWSVLLGSHAEGDTFAFSQIRQVLREGWPMVQVSYVPIVVMLAAWAVGASNDLAVELALGMVVVLFIRFGAMAGSRLGLHGLARVGTAAAAGLFGALFVLLKAALH